MDLTLAKNTIQALCVALLLGMLWAPALQERLNLVNVEPLKENRFRAQRPTNWRALFTAGPSFTREYEKYFNDTFGFRDFLIRAKHQVDYSVFRESDEIIVGREGWLFYRDVLQQQYYIAQISDEVFARIVTRMEALRAALAARGMTLVLFATPAVENVYREMLPSQSLMPPAPTRADLYRTYLRNHSEFVIVDAVSLVQALKHRFRVFHKTDFHWTDPAAAYAAKELVDTLGKHAGLGPLWDQPIELATGTKIDGGEMRAMGLLWPRAEEGLLLEETGIRKPRGSLVAHTNANNWTFAVDEPSEPKLLPPTVIFGDSFADALDRAGWLVYFRRLQKFYNWDVGKRYHEIPQDTRFVILQFSDGHLNAFANDEFWPAEIAMPGLPAPAGSASGALAANPNPVLLCNETGVGATTVAWTTRGTRTTEIHLGSPSGPMWVRGGSSGSAKTGQWVGKGMTFYLQDVTDNAPLDSNHTLASLKIDVAGGGACP